MIISGRRGEQQGVRGVGRVFLWGEVNKNSWTLGPAGALRQTLRGYKRSGLPPRVSLHRTTYPAPSAHEPKL